ncbi:DUF2213 domain-containing protein [Novosphingobium sp.]|uniref:DUF2213 domain-containing protein n=1 Tax=Novosphingobium sp. TaxID=1874826 RepID=UPI0028A8E1B9|nr:DUF2213 domain-containing protein [Novosphingobium sp.]
MQFRDSLTLDAPRRIEGGAMAVRARAARTGVYQYAGSEVDPENKHGLRDQALVNVLRDDSTVFDEKSVRSFIGKPVTDDHPAAPVTTANWRDHARGTIMGAMRDGDYLAFDLLLTDAEAIAKVEGGKRELSNGYSSDLEFGDFTAPDGTKCQARQKSIFGNHVALVDRGRAGAECAIKDGFAVCDALPSNLFDNFKTEKPVKTMLIDGLTVDMANADTAIATVQTLIAARDAAKAQVTDLEGKISAKDRELAAKDTEIADLKAKVSDEATLDARADAKAEIVAKGKAILGDKMPDVKGKSLADTRRAVVNAVVGDASLADKSDDYIEARFDGLKDAKGDVQPLGAPIVVGDAATTLADAQRKASEARRNAWKTPATSAAA